MREFALIDRYFRPLAGPAGRNLADDAAVLTPPPGRALAITKDMIGEGIHFLATDPAWTLGHKLLAVNLSDLAAMGAAPLACLLGLGLPKGASEAWVADFARGLGEACARHGCPLIGGDTISGLERPVLSLTAIGHVAPGAALARAGARAGDELWVSGRIGLAGLGLRLLQAGHGDGDAQAIARYRMPEPRLALGQALVGLASAAADVSDGLLADAAHIAQASGVTVTIALEAVPVAPGLAPLDAVSAGDDYELVFAAPPSAAPDLVTLSQTLGISLTRIGHCAPGAGLSLIGPQGVAIAPTRLGHEHETQDGQQQDAPETDRGEKD